MIFTNYKIANICMHIMLFVTVFFFLFSCKKKKSFTDDKRQATLYNYLENILSGKCSAMPYFRKKIDADGVPRIGFKCPICWHYFYDRITIMKDLMRHRYLFCQFCDNKKFRDSANLNSHVARCHKLEMMTRKFECKYCDEIFTDIRSYTKHAPCKFKFHCGFCDFETRVKKKLILHVKCNHRKENNHCLDCSLYFLRKDDLNKHVLGINDKTFVCPFCGIIFHTKEFLDAHLQIYGNKHICAVTQDNQTGDKDVVAKKEPIDVPLNSSSGVSAHAVRAQKR